MAINQEVNQIAQTTNKKVFESLVTWAPLVLLVASVTAFIVALPQINLRNMNDLGLISVLPRLTWVALALLAASFTLALSREPVRQPLLLLHVVVLIFMLYGITSPIEEVVPRFNVSWRHLGVVDYIIRNGNIDPYIDAYFNWPGFFSLNAFTAQNAGSRNSEFMLPWISVMLNLLYLPPLLMIMRGAANVSRLGWLGIWFFYLTNWIGQDYYSPQGLNFFFFLVIIAICVRWFKVDKQSKTMRMYWLKGGQLRRVFSRAYQYYFTEPDPVAPVGGSKWQLLVLQVVILVIFTTIVASHQLSPFSVVIALLALASFNRIKLRLLPILMILIMVLWIFTFAAPYFRGHMDQLLGTFGQVDTVVEENLSRRIQGSDDHLVIVRLRLLLTLLVWGLAFLGGYLRQRNGYKDVTMSLLAFAPFPLLIAAVYGGEMLLRVYLFSLPFVAFFIASFFFPNLTNSFPLARYIGVFLVSLIFGFGLYGIRYGNERMDQFTKAELDAVQHVYDIAKPGSLLAVTSTHLPFKYRDYEVYVYEYLADEALNEDIVSIESKMSSKGAPQAYLILTRSQRAFLEMFYSMPPKNWDRLEQDLAASSRFKEIFTNEDARVFALQPKP